MEIEEELRRQLNAVDGFAGYELVQLADGCMAITTCRDQSGCHETTTLAHDLLVSKVPTMAVPPDVFEGPTLMRFVCAGGYVAVEPEP